MALVVSDSKEMTVIILEREDEAVALAELLDVAPPELAVVLDELTNAMLTKDLGSAYRPDMSSPNYMVGD
jgi:hypothetical protein